MSTRQLRTINGVINFGDRRERAIASMQLIYRALNEAKDDKSRKRLGTLAFLTGQQNAEIDPELFSIGSDLYEWSALLCESPEWAERHIEALKQTYPNFFTLLKDTGSTRPRDYDELLKHFIPNLIDSVRVDSFPSENVSGTFFIYEATLDNNAKLYACIFENQRELSPYDRKIIAEIERNNAWSVKGILDSTGGLVDLQKERNITPLIFNGEAYFCYIVEHSK